MKFKYKKVIRLIDFEKEFEFLTKKVEKVKFPQGFFEFLFYVISELFENIKEHAKIEKGLLILEINKNQCLIKVIDRGIGLRQSYLRKKIFPKDDFSAIEFALSGLSTKLLQERGFGLYSIRNLVEKLDGEFIIETGLAQALIQKNRINFQKLSKRVSGTRVEIKVPIKRIDFYKIVT